jgi:hypothetical protein
MLSGTGILRVCRFMTKVYMRHIRKCRYCGPGIIKFCEDRGFNLKYFLKHGIEIAELREFFGDEKNALVERAIKLAEKESK